MKLEGLTAKHSAARKPKPEPQPVKLLSFDEAVQAIREGRGVQVQEPWESIPRPIETTRQPKRQTLNFLDLAERRGWPITEIDGYDKGRRVYDASEKEQAK